jgi:hypothetical protein
MEAKPRNHQDQVSVRESSGSQELPRVHPVWTPAAHVGHGEMLRMPVVREAQQMCDLIRLQLEVRAVNPSRQRVTGDRVK